MNEEPRTTCQEDQVDRSGDLAPDLAAWDESRQPRIEELVAFGGPRGYAVSAPPAGAAR
jgi:hypothetical protein